MGRTARKSKQDKARGIWNHLRGGSSFVDIHHGQLEPSKQDLMSAYEDVVFACVNYIADLIAGTQIRLYADGTTSERQKTLNKSQLNSIKNSSARGLILRKSSTVQEVTSHRLLDLLYKPNKNQNWCEFITLVDSYLEVAGQAFVHIEFNAMDLPDKLTILPSHLVTVLPDEGDGLRFEYFPSMNLGDKTTYKANEILHFKFPDLFNPYLDGLSPVRAIWERQLIGKKELSYLSNTFSNQARMDIIAAPDQPLGPAEAERLSKELTQRYRGAGAGGVYVPPEKMVVYPLQFPPKDLAGLELYKVIKTSVCNAFKFPPPLLDAGSNRSESESALYHLTRFSIVPRLVKIAAKLNELAALFDSRLWLEFDSPVPEDEQLTLQKRQQDLAEANMLAITGTALTNEIRVKYGLPETDWGNEPLTMSNMIPRETYHDTEPTTEITEPQAEQVKPPTAEISQLVKDVVSGAMPREAAIQIAMVSMGLDEATANKLFPEPPKPEAEESPLDAVQQATQPTEEGGSASSALLATVGGSQAIMSLQQAYYSNLLPRAAAVANATIIFGLSKPDAEALFPELVPDAPQSPTEAGTPATDTKPDEGTVTPPDAKPEPPDDKATDQLADDPQLDDKAANEADELAKVKVPEQSASRKNIQKKMVKILHKYFRQQEGLILQRLKSIKLSQIKTKAALTPNDYKKESYEWEPVKRKAGLEINVDLSAWVKPMAKELLPLVMQSSQEGTDATAERLGITVPKVVQPKLKEALQKATMAFCEETNNTTSLQLQDALAKLRDEIEEGTVQGDGRNEMRKRVQEVFDHAENDRSYRIAVTEQSRAISSGQKMVAEESGLVKGYKWVLSNMPCELCKSIAANNPEIPLDGTFATVSDHPVYGTVDRVPAHPHCMCSMVEILKD